MIRVRQPAEAQSLVEFALVLPIFLLLLFGLIEGGRLVFANNTVSQAAREAVRLAHVQAPYIDATDCTAPVCPPNPAAFRANVLDAANNMTSLVGTISDADLAILCMAGMPPSDWTGNNDCGAENAPEASNSVSVRITVPIEPILPFLDWFYPESITADSTMAIP